MSNLKNAPLLTIGMLSTALWMVTLDHAPAAEGFFCKDNRIEHTRCGAALTLLRGLLVPGQVAPSEQTDTTKTGSIKTSTLSSFVPAPKPRAGSVDPTTVVLGKPAQQLNREESVKLPAGATKANFIVPFPTPRPYFQSSAVNKPSATPAQNEANVLEVANNQCLDPAQLADPDIRNQINTLSNKAFCITETRVREGGLNWKIHTIQNTKRRGPLFVIPHDNENSAFPAGVYGLAKYGGTLVAVEAGERRIFKGQDPNRNFGTTRAAAAACPKQRAPAPKYTKAIMQHRKSGQPIIALHSNSNGWSGNGGSGTMSINRKSKVMLPFVTSIARSRRLADEDTLIVIASTKPPGKDRKQTAALEHFTKKAGVNVIYEYVKPSQNDCSLSNYVVLNKLGQYFNVEVENGDTKTQKSVLDIVMDYVR